MQPTKAIVRFTGESVSRSFDEMRAAQIWRLEPLEPRVLLSVTAFPIPAANEVGSMCADTQNNVWLADGDNNALDRIAPDGKVTVVRLPAHDAAPASMAAAPDGSLWVAEYGADKLARVAPNGAITEFSVPANCSPFNLTVAQDGSVWFIGDDGSPSLNPLIGHLSPSGAVTILPPLQGGLVPDEESGMASAYGSLWCMVEVNGDSDALASIDNAGNVTIFPTSFAIFSVMAVSRDGTLWISDDGLGQNEHANVYKVTADGAITSFAVGSAGPFNPLLGLSVAPAADGGMWVATADTKHLAHISAQGAVTEVPIALSGPGDSIWSMAVSSDGTLWCQGALGNEVYRFQPSDTLLAAGESVSLKGLNRITGPVASFTDLTGNTDPSRYSASLTFDDGLTIGGTVTVDASNTFHVTTTHLWPMDASNLTVTITDNVDGRTVVAHAQPDTVNDTSAGGGSGNNMVADANSAWFVDANCNTWVTHLTRGGPEVDITIPDRYSYPANLISGSQGSLWFTNVDTASVMRMTTQGQFTEFPVSRAGIYLGALAAGADGNIYFIENTQYGAGNQGIGQLTPSGGVKLFPVYAGVALFPNSIAATSDGNIWFLAFDDQLKDYIGRLSPDGSESFFPLQDNHTASGAIIAGADGNIWVGSQGAVERVSPSGAVTSFPVPDPNLDVMCFATAPNGDLWFAGADNIYNGLGYLKPDGSVVMVNDVNSPYSWQSPYIDALAVTGDGTVWYHADNGADAGSLFWYDPATGQTGSAAGATVVIQGTLAAAPAPPPSGSGGPSAPSDLDLNRYVTLGSPSPAPAASSAATIRWNKDQWSLTASADALALLDAGN